MTTIWASLFELAFAILFVVAVVTIVNFFKDGDGGTFLKVFTRSFGNTSKEANAFLPHGAVEYTPAELGWKLVGNPKLGDLFIYEAPDGHVYATGNPDAKVSLNMAVPA